MLSFKYAAETRENIIVTLFYMYKCFLTIKLIIMPSVYPHILTRNLLKSFFNEYLVHLQSMQ